MNFSILSKHDARSLTAKNQNILPVWNETCRGVGKIAISELSRSSRRRLEPVKTDCLEPAENLDILSP